MKSSFKFFNFWLLLALGTAIVYGQNNDSKKKITNPAYYDKGVVINGVKWATRNVDAPGTFAANPEDAGMFYQWNRKKAWAATGVVTDWDATVPKGYFWAKANDPSPAGWRVPTLEELRELCDTDKVSSEWTIINGVTGRRFIDIVTDDTLFLPEAGYRGNIDGTLFDAGECGYYWSSTVGDEDIAYRGYLMRFDNANVQRYTSFSKNGFSIRAVAE